ncbi:unnamed protein product [Albugo candida]|uniref:Uncharacterized protein n=1 Tax=Albugo candida TaxID=65357 RepID=A0A024GA96_9STRA|nr:unnamed protein product [Albugo candida]|eukprot:CCI43693.1 unnamed protein product [Albugo candida]
MTTGRKHFLLCNKLLSIIKLKLENVAFLIFLYKKNVFPGLVSWHLPGKNCSRRRQPRRAKPASKTHESSRLYSLVRQSSLTYSRIGAVAEHLNERDTKNPLSDFLKFP